MRISEDIRGLQRILEDFFGILRRFFGDFAEGFLDFAGALGIFLGSIGGAPAPFPAMTC